MILCFTEDIRDEIKIANSPLRQIKHHLISDSIKCQTSDDVREKYSKAYLNYFSWVFFVLAQRMSNGRINQFRSFDKISEFDENILTKLLKFNVKFGCMIYIFIYFHDKNYIKIVRKLTNDIKLSYLERYYNEKNSESQIRSKEVAS